MLADYFNREIASIDSSCEKDDKCWSKNCVDGFCSNLLYAGRECTNDMQCESGICKNGHYCETCVGLNKPCGLDSSSGIEYYCCPGYICDSRICKEGIDEGQSCNSHNECKTGFCNSSGKCERRKDVDEGCSENIECFSRLCEFGKCEWTKFTEDNLQDLSSEISRTVRLGEEKEFLSNLPSLSVLLVRVKKENIFEKLIEGIVGGVLGGVILPMLNIILISKGVKDLSGFFGAELDISSIWRVI